MQTISARKEAAQYIPTDMNLQIRSQACMDMKTEQVVDIESSPQGTLQSLRLSIVSVDIRTTPVVLCVEDEKLEGYTQSEALAAIQRRWYTFFLLQKFTKHIFLLEKWKTNHCIRRGGVFCVPSERNQCHIFNVCAGCIESSWRPMGAQWGLRLTSLSANDSGRCATTYRRSSSIPYCPGSPSDGRVYMLALMRLRQNKAQRFHSIGWHW